MVTQNQSQKPPLPNPDLTIQKEQMNLLEATGKLLRWKIDITNKMDTKPLVEQLAAAEAELTRVQKEELEFKNNSRGFMASAGDDCSVVKSKLAELWIDAPSFKPDGKNATVTDKEAWLRQQRTVNADLKGLIEKQHQVLAGIEGYRVDTEIQKRKVESTLAVIRLKTSILEFLARSV